MTPHTLETVIDGHVATIWMNRPELRNAFNEHAIAELTHEFRVLDKERRVRVIVLAARGPAFCAGADLHWMKKMAEYSEQENLADAAALADMMHVIYTCSKPTVARVQGDCYAGGLGLVAACDIAVSAQDAEFCLSEVKLGLIPATISPYVIRAMGERAARRYFLSAERFSASTAHSLGLVHEVLELPQLDACIAQLTQAIVASSPHAVTEAKRLVREVAGEPIDPHLVADTVRRIAEVRVSPEGKEGVQAFLEKRKPMWLLDD
jgi:methylglutaconyl-CoA hydratase